MIRLYHFNTRLTEFLLIAPLKHGTRWISRTKFDKEISSLHYTNENLYKPLKEKISVENELSFPNTIFVYRDPLDTFKSAIISGCKDETFENNNKLYDESSKVNVELKVGFDTLDLIIANNGHFCYFLWRDIEKVLSDMKDTSNVKLVDLNDLSYYISSKTLTAYPYKHTAFSFENNTIEKFGMTNAELILECERRYPELWDNFMREIELETAALNRLVSIYKWIPPKRNLI
jgi:hypothetical protein